MTGIVITLYLQLHITNYNNCIRNYFYITSKIHHVSLISTRMIKHPIIKITIKRKEHKVYTIEHNYKNYMIFDSKQFVLKVY